MKKNLIDTSEMLQGSVDTKNIVDTLNRVLEDMNLSESAEEEKEIIDSFYSEIENWQVILIKPHQFKVWMQAPMGYYETTKDVSFIERVKLLLTKGLIVGSKSVERYADIMSNTIFPLELNLNPLQTIVAMQNYENKFYFTVILLLKRIENAIKEYGAESLAVYERPSGIVAINNAKHYLNEMEKLTHVKVSEIRESIEVVPFSRLIDESIIGIPCNIKRHSIQQVGESSDKVVEINAK